MKKFKYYYSRDKSKEAIGIVKAINLSEAIVKAAQKKDLNWTSFMKEFNMEEIIDEGKN